MLLLRACRGKGKFLSFRGEDLKGLFHARFSQLLCMSQHTSGLDRNGFFLNGNVFFKFGLKGLGVFLAVLSVYMTSLTCTVTSLIISALGWRASCAVCYQYVSKKSERTKTCYQNMTETLFPLVSVPNTQTSEVADVDRGRVFLMLWQIFWHSSFFHGCI